MLAFQEDLVWPVLQTTKAQPTFTGEVSTVFLEEAFPELVVEAQSRKVVSWPDMPAWMRERAMTRARSMQMEETFWRVVSVPLTHRQVSPSADDLCVHALEESRQ